MKEKENSPRQELVWAQIEKFVSPNPKFFITMTAINKVGINPRFSYGNPVGVYCYQLSPKIFEQLKKNQLPFVADKPYINVITVSDPILYIENYSNNSYESDKEIIRKEFDGTDDQWEGFVEHCEKGGTNRYPNSPFGKLWFLTGQFAAKTTESSSSAQARVIAWRKILITLGYPNISDPGKGIIHPAEPEQSLLMDVSQIKIVKTFLNPFASPDQILQADAPDQKTVKDRTKETQRKVDKKTGKVTSYSNGEIVEEAWVEPNDDGTYDKNGDLQVRPEPSKIIYKEGSPFQYIWERGEGFKMTREVFGEKVWFIYRSPSLNLKYRANNREASLFYDKGKESFEFYPDMDDLQNFKSGHMIYANEDVSGEWQFFWNGKKWEVMNYQEDAFAESGLSKPNVPKLPDMSFFRTQMKMPIGRGK